MIDDDDIYYKTTNNNNDETINSKIMYKIISSSNFDDEPLHSCYSVNNNVL